MVSGLGDLGNWAVFSSRFGEMMRYQPACHHFISHGHFLLCSKTGLNCARNCEEPAQESGKLRVLPFRLFTSSVLLIYGCSGGLTLSCLKTCRVTWNPTRKVRILSYKQASLKSKIDTVDFCAYTGMTCPEKSLAPPITLDKGTDLMHVLGLLIYTDQNLINWYCSCEYRKLSKFTI